MGFCLYNNIAIAAAHALTRGLDKVAIVDYDVHHGNGSQWMFYDDPRVLYLSVHQYPFYPGTGAADDVGIGRGAGYTVNIPLESGAGDEDYRLVFERVVLPILEAFAPDLLLLSAGYDAHDRDPLGGMHVSTEGYTQMTEMLRALADRCCDGRMAVVTEGGYDLDSLRACLKATLEVMESPGSSWVSNDTGSTERADAALRQVRRAQAPFWPSL
jgi:acetoin utilization deacetylase AcuC-like enzyme